MLARVKKRFSVALACLFALAVLGCSQDPSGAGTEPAAASDVAPGTGEAPPQPGGGVLAHPPAPRAGGAASANGALQGFASSLDGDPIASVKMEEVGEGAMVFAGLSESGRPFRGAVGGEIAAADYLPDDAPLLADSSVLAAMAVAGKILVRSRTPGNDRAAILRFYGSELTREGWEHQEIANPHGSFIRATKGGKTLQVSVEPGPTGSLVTLTVDGD